MKLGISKSMYPFQARKIVRNDQNCGKMDPSKLRYGKKGGGFHIDRQNALRLEGFDFGAGLAKRRIGCPDGPIAA